MYFCADWQFGKREHGSDWGADETIDYIRSSIVKAKKQIKALKKLGEVVDEIYIIGLGDLIENCYGFFDHQPFNIELTRTEQEHLARKMVLEVLDGLIGLAPKIFLGSVVVAIQENTCENELLLLSLWQTLMQNCLTVWTGLLRVTCRWTP